MNQKDYVPAENDRIDRTLRLIGAVEPRPGLEKRIAARLAHAEVSRPVRFLGLPRLAFGSAAVAVASVAIIAGSVNHSHRMLPLAPGVQLPGNSSGVLGTASGARVAPKAVAAPPNGRARSMRRTTAERNPPNGMAMPKGPLPQAEQTPQKP